MIQDYFELAINNLKHRGIRSWLTLLGILIGVMAVVALISLGAGLKLAISSQFGVSSTEVISIQAGGISEYGPPGSAVVNPLQKSDVEAIEKLSSVKMTIGRKIESFKLEFNDKIFFGSAINVPSGEKRDFSYEQMNLETEIGKLLEDDDNGKVVLGNNFYTDSVGLGKSIKPGDKVLIQDEKFEVKSILKKQGSFLYDSIVLMNDEDAEELFGYGNDVDIIAAHIKNKDLMDKAKIDIEKLMRKRRDVEEGKEDFEVSTPEAALSTVNDILTGVQIFIAIVASISIIVGAIGIINTMTTSVLERRKEIGIMKSVGATNNDIFMQFFLEASLMGLIGGLTGVLAGTGIGYLGTMGINNFIGASVSPEISFSLIFFTLIGSFVVGGVAGIVPAINAAKLNPVEALRT